MNLNAILTLNNNKFVNPLAAAQRSMEGFNFTARKVAEALGVIGVSFAAFKSAESVVEGFRQVFDTGKELKAIASTTGQSVRDIVVLRKAYSELGMEAGSLPGDLAKLQAALGGVNEEGLPTKFVFEQIGLSIDELKGKSAVQQFTEIGNAINGLASQESKMAAVRAIFGRAGAPMLNIFGNPDAIANAATLVGKQADIYEHSATHFAEISNKFENIGLKVKGFFVGLAEYVQPALLPILDKIQSVDTVGIAQAAGAKITDALQLLKAAYDIGKLSELLKLSVIVGMETAAPKIKEILTNAFLEAGKILHEAVTNTLDFGKNTKRDTINDFYNIKRSALSKRYAEIDDRASANQYHGLGDKILLANLRGEMEALEKERHSVLQREGLEIPSAKGESYSPVLSESKKALDALVSTLRATFKPMEIAEPSSEKKSGGFANVKEYAAPKKGSVKEMEGDRLAKIGLFVGAGGPANEHARKTAENTSKIVNLTLAVITKLDALIQNNNFSLTDQWA